MSIEAKYTDKAGYRITQAELHKAENIALIDGREMVFVISFSGEEWVVIREEAYREIYHDALAARFKGD